MSLLRRLLENAVERGDLTLVDASGRAHRRARGPAPKVVARLTDRAAVPALVLRPELRLGELYVDGRLVIEEGTLEDLLDILMAAPRCGRSPIAPALPRWLHRLVGWLRSLNPLPRAARNARHHYDLGNDLYRAFLDPAMQYSCAYFARPDDDLATAQRRKMAHIASKLRLEPHHHVLDIGCGWGGLALHLAATTGCRVTGLTLAHDQAALARERVEAAGLDDRVEIRLQDYRQVEGRFDRIVSVGMFEHVGPAHYDEYFRHIRRLLTERGVALVHSIGRAHGPMPTNPWLARYIFPGGYIPALSEVLPVVEENRLWTTDLEIWRLHYARTLQAWRERFDAAVAADPGRFDARFRRLWRFYLVGSELFFRRQDGMVFQLQLAREREALPITRDYMLTERVDVAAAPDAAPASEPEPLSAWAATTMRSTS
ncbi:MAG: class I SAM-dependent methyltransferase [Alphaproteobacteria bacterium]